MSTLIDIDFRKIYTSLQGLKYKIVEDLGITVDINNINGSPSHYVKIKFLDSGYEIIRKYNAVICGKVKDYSEFERIHGKNYKYIRKTINNDLDSKILNILFEIENRCYNPKSAVYKTYGALGVRVCDRWFEHPDLFIEDFKKLEGYEDWYNAPDDQKCLYQIDKDFKQQNIPINQRIYGPDTCIIIHKQINCRLAHNNTINYIGVYKEKNCSYKAYITNNNIHYRLGNYTSEIAAASIYNHFARQLPNPVLNDLGDKEMNFDEALTYFVKCSTTRKISIPLGTYFPSNVNGNSITVVYDDSKYNGIKKFDFVNRVPHIQFGAFDQNNNIINLYDNEIAAVNALEYYCQDNGLASINQLNLDQMMTRDMVNSHRLMNDEEYKLQCRKTLSNIVYMRKQKHNIWKNMYNNIVGIGMNFRSENLLLLDFKWHTLNGFIDEIEQIDGYKEWEDAGFPDGYIIENYIKQSTVMPDQRVWNKDVCTIIKDPNYGIITQTSKEIIDNEEYDDNIKYYGVIKDNHVFYARIKVNNKQHSIGTFDHAIYAAAAYNYYAEFYHKKRVYPLNKLSRIIPASEWQLHKSNMRQLYHLIDNTQKKRLYHIIDPTKEI